MERTAGGIAIDVDRDEEEAANEILRDRFRLYTINIAEAEAKKNGMEISRPIMACVSDLAFKYAEQLAKDLELFSQHAGRKSVNMEDVILCAHRNNDLALSLRSFSNDLQTREPPVERKRRRRHAKDADVPYIPEE